MRLTAVILVTLALVGLGRSELTLEDHTRLNREEKKALELLKERIYPRITEDFMKNDLYLLRFLQAREFDPDKAELMMRNHIQWREDNQMNATSAEDWTELQKRFPYRVDGRDKYGRPILLMNFKKWDVSSWNSDPEKHKKLVRHFNKMTDDALAQVMAEQRAGHNVTQFLWLVDMDKVNVMQHVNIPSASFYWDITSSWEINNPKLATKIMLLNSPSIFHNLIIPGMRQIMSVDTDEAFDDYRDKGIWKPLLDRLVDESELPPQYGGKKGQAKVRPTPASNVKGGGDGGSLVGTYQRQPDGTWKILGRK